MRKPILTLILALLLTILSACTGAPDAETMPPAPSSAVSHLPKLIFTVVEMESPGYIKEELDSGTDLVYFDLAEVNITLDDVITPLADALRSGQLSLPEIFAYARMDAKNGFCEESYVSRNGLTDFTYTYPQCELLLTYDVYETPDGRQHLIEEICMSSIPGESATRSISHLFIDEESEWGYFLDREDWGITFQVAEASPTQVTLSYTQRGGQQIGDLFVEEYMLNYAESKDSQEPLSRYIDSIKLDCTLYPLQMNGAGQITLDWSEIIDPLAPGDYQIKLSLYDSYEETQLHPLMTNFTDHQSYWVEFTVQ